ncbi:MAG: DUF3127 domain-containing protein [Paludibacteraceae bacterium]
MEISGKIIAVLPQQSGQGKNGQWRSQDYVLETGDQYPKKVCFNLFNDKIDKFPIAINDAVTISFDIESREYNGRWYTTVRAWNVKKETENIQPENMPYESSSAPSSNISSFGMSGDLDSGSDLPF